MKINKQKEYPFTIQDIKIKKLTSKNSTRPTYLLSLIIKKTINGELYDTCVGIDTTNIYSIFSDGFLKDIEWQITDEERMEKHENHIANKKRSRG